MLNPVSLTESSICNHVDSVLGNNCNAYEYKTLVLWAWQAYPGIVHVPERARSEFGKSQLQLIVAKVFKVEIGTFDHTHYFDHTY